MTRFKSVSKTKVSDSIVEQIIDQIDQGTIAPGDSLPSERELAELFAVSRGSVREALRVLEHSRVVDVRVGSGVYVTENAKSRATMMRAEAAAVGDHSPLDLVAARITVEPRCASLAAAVIDSNQLEHLGAVLRLQEELTMAGEDPAAPDLDFHLGLAHASGNTVLASIMERLGAIMQQPMWSELKGESRTSPSLVQKYLAEHQAILNAVEARDSVLAERLMLEHLEGVEAGLTEAYSRFIEQSHRL